jgi:hypothetical protein
VTFEALLRRREGGQGQAVEAVEAVEAVRTRVQLNSDGAPLDRDGALL